MFEWSKKFFAKKENTSLVSAYKDVFAKPFLKKNPPNTEKVSVEKTSEEKLKQLVEDRITKLNLKNITLVEKPYNPQTWQEMQLYFQNYQRNRIVFLKLLGYSHRKELKKLGLKSEDIKLMKEGIAPENYNTHIKIPFDFGGRCNLSNLSLIKSHPAHDYLHSIIDIQIEHGYLKSHKKIFIPYFEGKIYYD